jgi:hypothetical protein
MTTRNEFALRLEAAHRRGNSIIWSFYISTLFAMFSLIAFAIVFLCVSLIRPPKIIPADRAVIYIWPLWLIAFCLGVIGMIKAAESVFWKRWLKRMGMQCPTCGTFLNYHYGNQYASPPCACDSTTRCRKVWDSGICDKCGERIFEL